MIFRMRLGVVVTVCLITASSHAADPPTPKSAMTCGKCLDGYVSVGVGKDLKLCPETDGVIMQCVALGVPRIAVCGECPSGYVQVGTSMLPARCGDADGGRMSQCQLENLGAGLPETAAPKVCPPDCGTPATPGHGGGPVPQLRDLRPQEEKTP